MENTDQHPKLEKQDSESIDFTCNSTCNIHYHLRKHAANIMNLIKKGFNKLFRKLF